MSIERFILNRLLGWKVTSGFPEVKKSIMVFAPHTSYWDAVIGKLILRSYGTHHTLLSASDLFRFPMSIAMHMLGAVPIGGRKGHNSIHDAVRILHQADEMHLVICPEGQLAATDRWNPGFYYMAVKAGVPIVVVSLDYARKEAGVKGIISDLDSQNEVYRQLATMYDGVTARHPEKFKLPRYK